MKADLFEEAVAEEGRSGCFSRLASGEEEVDAAAAAAAASADADIHRR